MFEKFIAGDGVLRSQAFIEEEVEHNLIHMIGSVDHSMKVKTADDQLIFAQTSGYNPWLWISRELETDLQKQRIESLLDFIGDRSFPGVSAAPNTANLFAESYCTRKGRLYHNQMTLIAYYCPSLILPAVVEGKLLQANKEHSGIVAEFMAGFSEDAFGMPAAPDTFLSMAEEAVRSGQMYLWVVEEIPVSMAKIAHISTRHGRINDVFTPRVHRKKGYASAVVAEICQMLLDQKITPMLYADAKNPDSNKVYQSIGFVEAGRIAEIRFA